MNQALSHLALSVFLLPVVSAASGNEKLPTDSFYQRTLAQASAKQIAAVVDWLLERRSTHDAFLASLEQFYGVSDSIALREKLITHAFVHSYFPPTDWPRGKRDAHYEGEDRAWRAFWSYCTSGSDTPFPKGHFIRVVVRFSMGSHPDGNRGVVADLSLKDSKTEKTSGEIRTPDFQVVATEIYSLSKGDWGYDCSLTVAEGPQSPP